MGRNRKDGDPLGLTGTRLAFRRGKFWYRHRLDDRFECVGADIAQAKKRAALYNDPTSTYGTVGYWMAYFIADCDARVRVDSMKPRTLADYKGYSADGGPLMIYFGMMLPEDIQPNHVNDYLGRQAKLARPTQGNREKACLSAMLSWLLRKPDSPIKVNPCLRGSGITRNPERKRERYVTHEEFHEVMAVATRSERLLMETTYRTLQRPESDIIHWTTANLTGPEGARVLVFKQNKTKRSLRVAISRELETLLTPILGDVVKIKEPLIRTLKGEPYTYDGLCSMLKRSIAKANALRATQGLPPMKSFGYRDLKGKGATDMYFIDKVPIEQIQQLLGHASVTTTEIYIKARWREVAQSNAVVMAL